MIFPGDHVVDYVDAYLHEALALDEMRYVREHCDKCQICRLALEEAKRRLQAVQSLPPVEAPESLIQIAEQRIARHRRIRRRTVAAVWSAIAASMLIAAGMHLYYATLAPSPYDLRILGQAEWTADSRASLRVVLWDRRRDAPIEDVPVKVELGGQRLRPVVHLASFTTNRFGSGAPVFRLPDQAGQEYELRVRADVGAVRRDADPQRQTEAFLASDAVDRQAGVSARPNDPPALLGLGPRRSQAGGGPRSRVLGQGSERQRDFPPAGSDQPFRHRRGRLSVGSGDRRRRLPAAVRGGTTRIRRSPSK